MSKQNSTRTPFSNQTPNRYLKKQTATNSFNDKFTIYADMGAYLPDQTPTHKQQYQNSRYEIEYLNHYKFEDSNKIYKLKQTLRSLNMGGDFNEEYSRVCSSRYENDDREQTCMQPMSTHLKGHSKSTNNNYHLCLQPSSIQASRLSEIDENEEKLSYTEHLQKYKRKDQAVSKEAIADYNQKLDFLDKKLRTIQKKSYNHYQPDKKIYKDTEPLRPASNSLILEKQLPSNKIKSSYSYAFKQKQRQEKFTPKQSQQDKSTSYNGINKSISVMEHQKKSHKPKQVFGQQFFDESNTQRKMKGIGKNCSHYNFSEYYKKSPYRPAEKESGSSKGKSHSKTQKIINYQKVMDKIKEENVYEKLPQKILAPKLGIKYLQDKLGKSKEMRASKNGQNVTKTSRGKRSSYSQKEEELIYHKIDSKMSSNRPESIQYFNNQSFSQAKSKSKPKSINSLNKSANRSIENILKKPKTQNRKRIIQSVHRAQIQEIIPLAFDDQNKKVCYTGSTDFYISRIEFRMEQLLDDEAYEPNIDPLYRHGGAVTDLIIGRQNRYILSSGKDLYIKIGVLTQEDPNNLDKCCLHDSFKFDSTPMKLSTIGQDIIGVATVRNLAIYDINKNSVNRKISYPSISSNQNSTYFDMELLSSQMGTFLGNKRSLYYIDYRCVNPFVDFYSNSQVTPVEKWLINKNCNQYFGFITLNNQKYSLNIADDKKQITVRDQVLGNEGVADFTWKSNGKQIDLLMNTGEVKSWSIFGIVMQQTGKLRSSKRNSFERREELVSVGNFSGYNRIRIDCQGVVYMGNSQGDLLICE